jgi:hypothetical protein
MTLEYILINLKRELIRTLAVVDEWFDRDFTLLQYRPASGGWTVSEVLEHITVTNHYLLIIIEKGTEKALRRKYELTELLAIPASYTLSNQALLAIAQPDAFLWQHPEHHQPTGLKPLCDVRRTLRDQLEQCLITLELLPDGEGTLHRTTMSVNNLGKLDVYQYIYFLALHAQRHIHQLKKIEEEYSASSVACDA